MNQNKELARWVERARDGDAQAFAHLYSRFSRPVYFAALKMTGNEFDAKDVLQDVMIRLYQSIDSIRSPQALGSFLNTTTYRTCLRRLERERRYPIADNGDLRVEQMAETSTEFIPEDYADRQETRELVGRLVEELSPALKSVVLLYYFEEMPVRAIAKTLDLNKQTVKSRLEYARAVLKRKLDAQRVQADSAETQGVLRAMSVPVLTKILQQQAQQCLQPEISAQVWEQVGAQIGLSATAVAATAAIAASSGAVTIAAGTVAGAKAVSSAIALISLAAVATTGTVIVATRPGTTAQPPPQAPPPVVETAPPTETADDSPVIDFSPPAEEDLQPSSIPLNPYTEPDEDKPHPSDNGPRATPSRPAAGATTPAAESDALPAPPPGGGGSGGGSGGTTEPGITLRVFTLHYPTNTALSEEIVLRDSGAAYHAPLEIVGLDLVDPGLAGENAVYVQPQSAGGETSQRKVLIIVIE